MTVSQMVDQLVLRCGNRKIHQDLLESELAYAITELEEQVFHPWFLLTGRRNTSTIIGDDRVPLPVDFIAEYDDGDLWLVENGQKIPLEKTTMQAIHEAEEVSGKPTHYAAAGSFFRLYPSPDKVYDLQMMYYAKSGALGDDNVWVLNASQYLISVAMQNYATNVRDQKLYKVALQKRQVTYNELLARHAEFEIVNRDTCKGD